MAQEKYQESLPLGNWPAAAYDTIMMQYALRGMLQLPLLF